MSIRVGGALDTDDQLPAGVAGIGALGSVAAGGFLFGLPGALVGGILVAAWLLVRSIVVVALGQLLFAALLSADSTLLTMLLVEAPLLVIFFGATIETNNPLRTLVLGVGILVTLGVIVGVGVAELDALWQVGALLVTVAALLSYGLHRYTVAIMETTDEF